MNLEKFRNPFSADDFVERISRTTSTLFDPGALTEDSLFDPSPLLHAFEEQIEHLWQLHDDVAREVAQREQICREKEQEHRDGMEDLEEIMQEAFQSLQSLSTRINDVATKTVHVGDQLEGVNAKRRRALEAAVVMRHFDVFDKAQGQLLPPFDNITHSNIHEAADIIQKLKFIADEMPPGQVSVAKDRIAEQLNTIKSRLLQSFEGAYGDYEAMKEYAHTLFPFQAYSTCIDYFTRKFIDEEFSASSVRDVCGAILFTCAKAKEVIDRVFLTPHVVFADFVAAIIDTKLKAYVTEALMTSGVQQLETLHDLYKRSRELLQELSKSADLGGEGHIEDKLLRKQVFEKYLATYIEMEQDSLHDIYERLLVSFYEGIGHVSWGLRGKEPAKGKKKLEVEDKQSPTETMLSLDVAFNMIHENKRAIERCKDLASPSDRPDWVYRIFQKLLEGLCNDHVSYAVKHALLSLPSAKTKGEPPLLFLSVVRETNNLFYLLQKHFWDDVLPYVRSSLSVYPKCVQSKNDVMDQLEAQLATGLETLMAACVEWLRIILSKEQKKTDFKPADESMMDVINGPCTEACRMCTGFLNKLRQQITSCLNGKNMENTLRYLGTHFHAVLLEHVRNMSFSILGGMLLVRDMTEYERCAQQFNDPSVLSMFVTLRELSAIVIVRAENIKQLCEEGRLATLDRTLIQTFLQLRTDYKSAKLSAVFRV